MTDVPAQGYAAQVGVDTVAPIDVSSTGSEVLSCGLKSTETHVHSPGLRGTRSRLSYRVRATQEAVSGPMLLHPTASEIDFFLPYILGGATAAGVTDVADTLGEFVMSVDKVTKVYTYTAIRVSRATFSGTAGQPIELSLDLEAESESEANAGTFPAMTFVTDNMFIMGDCTLTLLSTARKFKSFQLVIDNMLDADRYNNSTTRSEIPAQDREVTLTVGTPFTSDNSDLYDAAIAGAAGSLVINDGSTTYTVDFGNCKIPKDGATVDGKSEIDLPITVNCFDNGTNSECKVTKT